MIQLKAVAMLLNQRRRSSGICRGGGRWKASDAGIDPDDRDSHDGWNWHRKATRNAVLKAQRETGQGELAQSLDDAGGGDPRSVCDAWSAAHVAAASGMDALCQLIEAFVSCRANAMDRCFVQGGDSDGRGGFCQRCVGSGRSGCRAGMLLAACWSGVALANAGLGAVHGFAAVAGGVSAVPHGLICARLLALVCRANIEALERIPDSSKGLDKYRELAVLLTGNPQAKPLDGVAIIEELRDRLPLATGGITATVPVEQVVSGAQRASSMKGNPVVLPGEVLTAIWSDYAESFSARCAG